MIFDNRHHRFAYRSGFCTVQCGDLSKNTFFDNPYDYETQFDLFCYWQLGFEDAYEEEMDLLHMISNGDFDFK